MNDNQKKAFLGGFNMCAKRQEDGKLHAYLGPEIIDEWPEEIELCGHTYTLEETIKLAGGHEEGVYV